jgi:hypothetical protein
MTTFGGWPIEATADDLRNAILLCVDLGLERDAPTLQLLRAQLRAKLRLERSALLPRHDLPPR